MCVFIKFSFELVKYEFLLEFVSKYIKYRIIYIGQNSEGDICWLYKFVCLFVVADL